MGIHRARCTGAYPANIRNPSRDDIESLATSATDTGVGVVLSNLERRFSRSRMVSTWLWCSSRSVSRSPQRVAQHGVPVADGAVGGDQDAAPFVAAADELEQRMGGGGLKRQIAELVHNQQLGLGQLRQPLQRQRLPQRQVTARRAGLAS
jgi:hypothetical protein